MIDGLTLLVFRSSRLKMVPLPILYLCFLILWYRLLLRISAGFHYAGIIQLLKAQTFFVLPFLLIVGMGIYSICQIINPPRLILSSTGWTITGFLRSKHYKWVDFGEPRTAYVAGGRVGYYAIKVTKTGTDDELIMPSDIFNTDRDTVLRAVMLARAGDTPESYQEDYYPISYVAGWIPLSVIVFLAILLSFLPNE